MLCLPRLVCESHAMPTDGHGLKCKGQRIMKRPKSAATLPSVGAKNPSQTSVSVEVPAEKLLELLDTSNEMIGKTFLNDYQAMLHTATRRIHSLLAAEACGIFLVSEACRGELLLEASYGDKLQHEFSPVRLKIQSVEKGGLTGHIAHAGKVVRRHGADLWNIPYVAGKSDEHLVSGQCFSLLGVPLKDRKGRVLGVLKVDNKKGPDGKAGDTVYFTEVDEYIAILLVNQIVIALEKIRTSKFFAKLTQSVHTARTIEETLNTTIEVAQAVLHADRGDIHLWSESKRDLLIAAQRGESKLVIGQPTPDPSLTRTLWKSAGPYRFVPDVSAVPDYYRADERTRSEVLVLLELDGRAIGVLNVESFQLNGFDEQDLVMLQTLAQHATIAIQVVGRETHFHEIAQRLGERPPQESLTGILESVQAIYGLDGGIIYIADDTNRTLRCSAFISEKNLPIDDLTALSYSYDESALATEVLHKKQGYFCPDPFHDPIVNLKGLWAFQIESRIVGVPLLSGEKVVGVLVVWSQRQPRLLSEEHIKYLEPFARLAAASIAISTSERGRTDVLRMVQTILAQMQIEPSREKNLRWILHGAQAIGFDRVRVFQFKQDIQGFVCLDSLGIDSPGAFRGITISPEHNPYTKHLVETAVSQPWARKLDPTNPNMFGPSPNGPALGKPRDLPWVDVPLVIGGKLYGYIAADNAHSKKEITEQSLDYMTLLGALAAQAIANAEMIDMVSVRNLPIFSSHMGVDASKSTVLRRLLVYLTAGEALGFSRALFLRLDERLRNFVYTAGLGSVALGRHQMVSQNAQEKGMEWLLAHVDELSDPELDSAMEGFQLNAEELRLEELLRDVTTQQHSAFLESSRPRWITALAHCIKADDLLVVPVATEKKVLGLFVTDRQWQERKLNEADKLALATFARLAAANIVLSESELQRTRVLEEIQGILTQMQTELSPENNLRLILRGVQAASFDRVRAFQFQEDTQSFGLLDVLGMEESEQLREYTLSLEHNPYARDTVETALLSPKARKYDYTKFGPDPEVEAFGKDPCLPWAVVPLVISGRLYGQITADNTPTRREITPESLDYLTLLGTLAAQIIANAETTETLRTTNRIKDEFLQRMAHIFGSTISGVDMLVQNLRDGIVDSERALQEYIPRIAKMNERFLGLMHHIIDFAALPEDTKLNLSVVDFTSLVKDTMDRLQRPAQEREVQFVTSYSPQPFHWELDEVRTSNAVEMLLDNAIKFSPPGSTVDVQLQVQDCTAKLVIRDEGSGIPKEDLLLVFDSFYRGRNARDNHVDGTGLGLAIVAQTMKLHGGRAHVRNHPEGGAEFTLIFPKTPGKELGRDRDKEAHPGGR